MTWQIFEELLRTARWVKAEQTKTVLSFPVETEFVFNFVSFDSKSSFLPIKSKTHDTLDVSHLEELV